MIRRGFKASVKGGGGGLTLNCYFIFIFLKISNNILPDTWFSGIDEAEARRAKIKNGGIAGEG